MSKINLLPFFLIRTGNKEIFKRCFTAFDLDQAAVYSTTLFFRNLFNPECNEHFLQVHDRDYSYRHNHYC